MIFSIMLSSKWKFVLGMLMLVCCCLICSIVFSCILSIPTFFVILSSTTSLMSLLWRNCQDLQLSSMGKHSPVPKLPLTSIQPSQQSLGLYYINGN